MSEIVQRCAERLTIAAELVLDSPLSIGGAEGTGARDQLVTVDGAGRPIIPATSLVGVLRAELTATRPEEDTPGWLATWFGGAGDDDEASRVSAADTVLRDATVELRDGVGIDRVTGTAAPSIKYNREVVAAGARATIELDVEVPPSEPPGEVPELVRRLVGLLDAGIAVGSYTSKGQGRLAPAASGARVVRMSYRSREEALAALDGGIEIDVEPIRPQRRQIGFTMSWTPLGSMLVRAGVDGNVVDDLPLVTAHGSTVTPVLPGSSIKGALRSRAEHIVRTVLELDASRLGPDAPPDGFNDQLDVPLVGALFGRPAAADESGRLRPQGRAAVAVHECRAHLQLDATRWSEVITLASPDPQAEGVLNAELLEKLKEEKIPPSAATNQVLNAELLEKLKEAGAAPGQFEPVNHVAIDRWTSAASSGALFSTLEVRVQDWDPIRVELDLDRLERRLAGEVADAPEAAIFLLLLVLRDLGDGWVPLGFGVNRGHGSLQMTSLDIDAEESSAFPPRIDSWTSLDAERYQSAWARWIESWRAAHV